MIIVVRLLMHVCELIKLKLFGSKTRMYLLTISKLVEVF